jgi:hypothetical protein
MTTQELELRVGVALLVAPPLAGGDATTPEVVLEEDPTATGQRRRERPALRVAACGCSGRSQGGR